MAHVPVYVIFSKYYINLSLYIAFVYIAYYILLEPLTGVSFLPSSILFSNQRPAFDFPLNTYAIILGQHIHNEKRLQVGCSLDPSGH